MSHCQICMSAIRVLSKPAGRGNIQHRLVDMGVVKGTRITVVKKAPLGDPIEVKVKGCALALRMNEAAMISVAVEGEISRYGTSGKDKNRPRWES